MTQDNFDNGRLIHLLGIAPVKPAEFAIFRILRRPATPSRQEDFDDNRT